jgi:hypothetical protein
MECVRATQDQSTSGSQEFREHLNHFTVPLDVLERFAANNLIEGVFQAIQIINIHLPKLYVGRRNSHCPK